MHCCPAAEGCVLAALCARSEGHGCAVCAAGCAAECARFSWLQRQDRCGKTERRLLFLLPWLTQETPPLSWLLAKRRQASATQMALLLRGLPAQRHRSASLVEEEPASREAPQQHISRHPRSAVLVETLCPCEEELQQPGRAAHVTPSAVLRRAVSRDLKSVPGSTGDTDSLHRVASGTERGRSSHEQHSTVWRWQWGQTALGAATEHRVGAVSGWVSGTLESATGPP